MLNEHISVHDLKQSDIDAVYTRLQAAGTKFLLDDATQVVIPALDRSAAQCALDGKDVVGFLRRIRGFAAGFVDARKSEGFWTLVDACGFYEDALGSHWKYLTQERRERYLAWASELATSFPSRVPSNVQSVLAVNP